MTELASHPVVLDGLPGPVLDAAVTHLEDVLRECQLARVVRDHLVGPADPVTVELADLADGLVPHLEMVTAALRVAVRAANPDGTVRLSGELPSGVAPDLAHGIALLAAVNDLGRRGALLLESDPNVTHVISWAHEEAADQLHGRAPRPYGTGP